MKLIDSPDALAALGVLQAEGRRALDADEVAAALERPETAARLHRAVAGGSPKLWLRGDESERLDVPQPVVDGLGTAWREGADEFAGRFAGGPWLDRRLRLMVEGPHRDEALGDAFRRALETEVGPALRLAYAAESVPLADRSLRGTATWRWPLRVGFLGDDDSMELRQRTAESYHHAELTEIVDLADGGDCDLLIVPSALHLELASRHGVRASFALVLPLSNVDDTLSHLRGNSPVETARLAARMLGASAAAFVSSQEEPGDVYRRLLDELSHDRTADVALRRAATEPPMVVGDPSFLDATRVSRSLAEARRRVEDRRSTGRIGREAFDHAIEGFERYSERTMSGGWHSEGQNATVGAETMRELAVRVPEAMAAADEPAEPATRRLQAQVFARTDAGLARRRHAFAPGHEHSIQLRVGRSHLDWIQVAPPFPTDELPPDEEVHPLDVLMLAPGLLDAPVERRIWLPAGADSSLAEFALPVPADAERVSVTFHVLHRNTPLQAARLDGPVAEDDAAVGDTELSFAPGRAAAHDLDHQAASELVVFKNGPSIAVRRTGAAEAKSFFADLPGLDDVMKLIRDELFAKATGVFQLETDLGEGHGLELLVFLAQQGRWLRDEMLLRPGRLDEEELAAIGRVHAWSPYAPDFFPVEFLYDHPFPDDDARLCPAFATGDAAGRCPDCRAVDDPAYVCPSGFWALARVIERQVRDWDADSPAQPEASADDDEIHLVDEVIFAASDQVNEDQPSDVIAATFDRLSACTGGRAHRVKSWSQWVDTVARHYPALLVTLPHHVHSRHHIPSLQIGTDEELALPRMEGRHLMPDDATAGPMVLLLGCNTAAAEFAYQDFVRRLRDKGAPVVVATLTTVIGAQAAPLAERFVEQLWRQGEAAPLGEVMRRVRATMIRAGNPLALALAAYGDADWRLAPRAPGAAGG